MHPTLRPLNVGEILDRSFSLYRGHFGPLLGTSVALYLPLTLLGVMDGVATARGSGSGLGVLLQLVAVVLVVGGLTYQASRAYMGHPASVAESIRHGLTRFPALVAALALTVIGIVLGLFGMLIGALIVWVLLFAVVPTVVVERRGPIAALQRSAALAEGGWWRICAVMVVSLLIVLLPSFALQMLMATAPTAGDPLFDGLMEALIAVLDTLTYPFSVTATVILYYDRRVRAEGLDVELMAATAPVPA